jgi:ribosomal protein L7/L12
MMAMPIMGIFAFIVAFLLLLFFIAASSKDSLSGDFAWLVDWNAIADEELQSYLPHNKINAIKRYRILTHVDLKEAKEAVEYAIAHPEGMKKRKPSSGVVDTEAAGVRDLILEGRIDEAIEVYAAFMGVDEYSSRDAIEEMQAEINAEIRLSDDNFDSVHDLLGQGKKIEAIKQYRELTGIGLKDAKDAKDAVEDME